MSAPLIDKHALRFMVKKMLVQVKVNSVEYVAFNFNIVAKYICVMERNVAESL